MVYLNPGGFNFESTNLDGYGISNIVVATGYTILLYAACIYLWLQRRHPVVKMRQVGLMLMSVLVIHVFCFIVFTIYTLNGAWPCPVEFWAMNLYLPIGIGLWQAQNQQLIIVNREQTEMISSQPTYKPLLPSRGHRVGTARYWLGRFKVWYRGISSQGKYEGFVLIGIIVQFTVSMVVYNISRKFNRYGVVSHHTSPLLCRRGWEWYVDPVKVLDPIAQHCCRLPSIVWQFLWNYFFGPYVLWKIRPIRDIYHWRHQTIIAVVAGLIPGMMAMEIVTVAFPIYQIIKHKRAARKLHHALAAFDQKRLDSTQDSITLSSSVASSGFLKSKNKGKMYTMESLDACLAGNYDSLQVYSSCMELNGENIIFLTKVLAFRLACQKAFHTTCNSSTEFRRARTDMFRNALGIFITLVHSQTATYPINIESPIYNRLETIFGPATALVAIYKAPSRTSSLSATPWDDPGSGTSPTREFPMRSLSKPPSKYNGNDNGSSEHIVGITDHDDSVTESGIPFEVPVDFDESVFDAAYKSIRYMVWSETWQRYMVWKAKAGGHEMIGRAF
ncbi:MAG: hypothetical protein Q9166_006342 [cf. Caloplaca sp. 2 TL-2023]